MILSFYFFLSIISLLKSSIISAQLLECDLPQSIEIETKNSIKSFVYDASVNAKYSVTGISTFNDPEKKIVNFFIPFVTVSFSGHIVVENKEQYRSTPKTNSVFDLEITGSARVLSSNSQSSKPTFDNCDLSFARKNNEDDLSLTDRTQQEIIDGVSSCIKPKICQELSNIISEFLEKEGNDNFYNTSRSKLDENFNDNYVTSTRDTSDVPKSLNTPDLLSEADTFEDVDLNDSNQEDVGSFMDTVIDVAINEAVKKFQESNGVIEVSDINQHFSTGKSIFKVNGEFVATGGTFRDLTTITRQGNVGVSNSNLKWTASCGFGLSVAYLRYESYLLKYGRINVRGHLSAYIEGIGLDVAVAADYNQKPCRLTLENLHISKMGDINIKITGLGVLNKLFSNLISWITNKWEGDIIKKIEEKIRSLADGKLQKLNCEKYRKFISKGRH